MPEITVEELKFQKMPDPEWYDHKMEWTKGSDGTLFERKIGSSVIYKKTKEGYFCATCGSKIIVADVSHPVLDHPDPISYGGGGDVKLEKVPYCPKCEEQPNPSGRTLDRNY